jgi:hypothetical protein
MQKPEPLYLRMARAAEGYADPPIITANTTGNNFKLVLKRRVFDEAEEYCNGCCGHLAAYSAQDEQGEVESAYTGGVGCWLAGSHTVTDGCSCSRLLL